MPSRGGTAAEQAQLERLARSTAANPRIVRRAQIVARSLHGETVAEIAHALGVTRVLVRRWVARFDQDGIEGLADARRSAQQGKYSAKVVTAVIAEERRRLQQLGLPVAPWTMAELEAQVAAHLVGEEHVIRVAGRRIANLVAQPTSTLEASER